MAVEPSIPLPLDPSPPPETDDKRLWIGNIDSRLSEYSLLKILQQFGLIKKFDFLFHKCGPLKGQPRGYCFVTFEKREQAECALSTLNGKLALDKELVVKWAHSVQPDDDPPNRQNDLLHAVPKEEVKVAKNIHHQISAIEAKLKAMEEQRDKELEMCLSATNSSVENNPLQYIKNNFTQNHRKVKHTPYNRHDKKHHSFKRR